VKEYFGQGASLYDVTERKQHVLVPAISRHTPKAKAGQKLLDLGCGNGALYELFASRGYEYFGVDVSPDMVKFAQQNHPDGTYVVANAVTFTSTVKDKFDLIAAILLLPSLDTLKKVKQVVTECQKALNPGGIILFVVPHPCFDMYMRKALLGKKGVKTKWGGYFNTEAKYTFKKQFPKGEFEFEDYHYTLEDYYSVINESGLQLAALDECKPDKNLETTEPDLYKKYFETPGYLLLVCTKPKG
jgi:2-polyprenyl-3-methyl-5-hydroxy-6-metoxy-1,4-benzoquinol methylase